jgi:hypothetical protein
MKKTVLRRLVVAATMLMISAIWTDRLQAQQPLTFGNWLEFFYFDGVNPVDGAGFSISSPTDQIRIRVTDAGVSGDRFRLFSGATLLFETSAVPDEVDTGLFDAEPAWNDARLSHGEFLLAPGSYTFTLQVSAAGSGFQDGSGFIRADRVTETPPPDPTVVPEPASILLTATGLVALLVLSRRRRAC